MDMTEPDGNHNCSWLAKVALSQIFNLYCFLIANAMPALFLFLFLSSFLFILRERWRASRGGAEREGDRIPSRLHAVSTESEAGLAGTHKP